MAPSESSKRVEERLQGVAERGRAVAESARQAAEHARQDAAEARAEAAALRARLDEQMQVVREMHETLLRMLRARNEIDDGANRV